MKLTLLEMTQDILSSMDSDEINSINDTIESTQVTKIIRATYYDLITRLEPPEHFGLFNLTSSGTNTKPVLMYVPSTISSVKWIKYNCETTDQTDIYMVDMHFFELEDFLHNMYMLTESDTNVDTMSHGGQTYLYRTDVAPTCYTALSDDTLIFDSYDNTVDTTLQESKSQAYGMSQITFTLSDIFVPDLDEVHFPLLFNEAKALAWAELKQTQHAKAEQSARRGWINSQRNRDRAKPDDWYSSLPNYGRK